MADKLAQVGARIEVVLDELASSADPSINEKAEELVSLLVELYGGGLERILELIAAGGQPGQAILHRLTEDDLVQALLVVHGLHPVPLDDRVHDALESVRPYLGSHSGGVENLGLDDDGVLHLRLEGNCEGCPSSRVTVKLAIEDAIRKAAPEIAGIDVLGVVEEQPAPAGTLLQIGGFGPGASMPPGAQPTQATREEWATVDRPPISAGDLQALDVEGLSILICSVKDSLYAYRNSCASCGRALDGGRLEDERLTCVGCGQSFNVRLAGRSTERVDLYLQPLPLLQQNDSLRIAMSSMAS
jgi:Fe-S cluster biogenesis protein NfuA/nitrite reductase/ring-hydroxylating ferredoxin subunit